MRACVLATFVIASASLGTPVVIDFESYPDGAPSDDELVVAQYDVPAYLFTTFETVNGETESPAFERVGAQAGSAYEGFYANRLGDLDRIMPGSGEIGEFFLRGRSEVVCECGPFTFVIEFNDPALRPGLVTLDLLDLDGNPNPDAGDRYGSERWDIYVTDGVGTRALVGQTPEKHDNHADFDSMPFAISVDDPQGIARVELVFSGTKQAGIGAALDNIVLDGFVPTPATCGLLAFGTLFLLRRRR